MTAVPELVPGCESTIRQDEVNVGARWWSLDIHAHSPASFDFGGLEGKNNDDSRPSFKEWIQAYIDAGLDGIVVTDHNSHAGIESARQALDEIRQEEPNLRPFVIFPGVELTATGGIHLLAIFDPACKSDVVSDALAICRYTGARGDSNQTANMTVANAAEEIVKLGGLCVPAHADQPRGVFRMDQRELQSLAKSTHVLAAEVVDDAEVARAGRFGWVPLLGSDSHHLTTEACPKQFEAKAPGTHLTLIKAETLDLEGIRLALTDPSESVRRCRTGYDDPNRINHASISRITVKRGGSIEEYRFGPWMNCVIGGRGVGKSTLVEMIRLALARSHELTGTVAQDLVRFHPNAEPASRWWDGDTQIVLHYTKDQRLLRVTWTGTEPSRAELELWTGEAWERQSGRVADRAPVRIFSQKQIYELANSPQSFLKILDDMPAIRRNEWDEEFSQLVLKFKSERNQLRQLLAETERADRLRGQLEEVQGRLQHLAALRASDEYKELESTEERVRDATTAERRAQTVENSLTADAAVLRTLVTDPLLTEEFADRAASFTAAAALIEEAAGVLSSGRAAWVSQKAGSTWQERLHELNEWLTNQGGSSTGASEQTQADRQREAELLADLREVENSEQRRKEQQERIDGTLDLIKAKREELFERRRSYAAQLSTSPASPTKVEVHHQGDMDSLSSELRELLNCPESFDSAFSRDGIGGSLLQHEPKDPSFPARVQRFKDSLIELVEEGTGSEVGRATRVDARFYTRLAGADTFDLATGIMLWFPEDLVSVRYRPREGGDLIAVDRGSPGQKTAALLTVILQMGNEPLVLDQPEDDLENKLIRHLAVETLRNIKSSRQLIVSTHNANIVVTSGAENILVLEHGESAPAIDTEGSLQTPTVKGNVCEILEGGQEAITTRYRRLVRQYDS